MTSSPRLTASILAVAVAAVATWHAPARAESRAEEDVTPARLSRQADAIAVLRMDASTDETPSGDKPKDVGGRDVDDRDVDDIVSVDVVDAVAGPVETGQSLGLHLRTFHGRLSLPAGESRLVFLVRDGENWRALAGDLGVWDVPAGTAGTATVSLVRSVSAAVRTGDDPQDVAALRRALVAGVADATPRGRDGAAMDLWMRPDVTGALDEGQAASLLGTFSALGNRSRARMHLARVLGRERVPGAGDALVGAILGDRGQVIAAAAGEALGMLDDAKAIGTLAGKTATGDIRMRLRVTAALGNTGRPAARSTLESLASDGEPSIRSEAVQGLGRLRSAEAAPALLRRFAGERPESKVAVRRALVWALAQCDDADAWSALKKAAADEQDEGIRRFAAEMLRNPRRGFVR